jgi:hypothetical protein
LAVSIQNTIAKPHKYINKKGYLAFYVYLRSIRQNHPQWGIKSHFWQPMATKQSGPNLGLRPESLRGKATANTTSGAACANVLTTKPPSAPRSWKRGRPPH